MTLRHALTQLALWGVPRHLRASVAGDLQEAGDGLREALAIAWHFQAEPYRERAVRRSALLLLLAAVGLLWVMPMAANALLVQAVVFTDPFSLVALRLWGAPAVVAAVASGLLVGRASLLPTHADAVRMHLVLVLAPWAGVLAPGAMQAGLAAALLVGSGWLGLLNRSSAPGREAPARG